MLSGVFTADTGEHYYTIPRKGSNIPDGEMYLLLDGCLIIDYVFF